MKKIKRNYDFSKYDVESFFTKYSNYVNSVDYQNDLMNYYYIEIEDKFQREFSLYIDSIIVDKQNSAFNKIINDISYNFVAMLGSVVENFSIIKDFKVKKDNYIFSSKEGKTIDGNKVEEYQIQFQ